MRRLAGTPVTIAAVVTAAVALTVVLAIVAVRNSAVTVARGFGRMIAARR